MYDWDKEFIFYHLTSKWFIDKKNSLEIEFDRNQNFNIMLTTKSECKIDCSPYVEDLAGKLALQGILSVDQHMEGERFRIQNRMRFDAWTKFVVNTSHRFDLPWKVWIYQINTNNNQNYSERNSLLTDTDLILKTIYKCWYFSWVALEKA